jgi:hypothetical protein
MSLKFLGKMLFPHLAPWQRQQQAKIMVWVLLTAVVFAVVVVAIMLLVNARR